MALNLHIKNKLRDMLCGKYLKVAKLMDAVDAFVTSFKFFFLSYNFIRSDSFSLLARVIKEEKKCVREGVIM